MATPACDIHRLLTVQDKTALICHVLWTDTTGQGSITALVSSKQAAEDKRTKYEGKPNRQHKLAKK